MDELMLRVDNVSKQYVLGQIGGTLTIESAHGKGSRIVGCIPAPPPTPTSEGV